MSSDVITIKSQTKCFSGLVLECTHTSQLLGCSMNVHIFRPPQTLQAGQKAPVLFFLSGLTCTDTNFIFKAGAMAFAAEHGIALVCPDTSPRGEDVPKGDSWDFGQGAGFYLNAVQEPYNKHYKMYDYIVHELPSLLISHFATGDDAWLLLENDNKLKQSIFGHSMGGLGSLVIYLRNLESYHSCSVFAPISHPSNPDCAWGQKAFKGYLGDSEEARQNLWPQYDPTLLISKLQVEKLEAAAKQVGVPLTLRMQEGYDHSYYFIQTFVKDHIEHHAKFLKH
ncbi:hypothetical protein C9374_002185 [Naegleria lovaniensis]|uniref:S-formylglutathione hydrolase n=1 Tax=Naegleria lovaniensis TaxID=51637 RepID=A0AA88KMF4_NAELO|nr:uncharacterized protein C9374_002185 [Naegleria lovaniensis]KAG2386441.1 hypothetical protein C9374_002185 [Naegleria lovaniensis]